MSAPRKQAQATPDVYVNYRRCLPIAAVASKERFQRPPILPVPIVSLGVSFVKIVSGVAYAVLQGRILQNNVIPAFSAEPRFHTLDGANILVSDRHKLHPTGEFHRSEGQRQTTRPGSSHRTDGFGFALGDAVEPAIPSLLREEKSGTGLQQQLLSPCLPRRGSPSSSRRLRRRWRP